MLIDVHMHVGRLYRGERRITPRALLDFMDRAGIARACLLPMENPEQIDYCVRTDEVLRICRRRPDRFLPFCNVDPRAMHVREVLRDYRDQGCIGYGETITSLAVDDPLLQAVYEACGELGLPIIFDLMAGRANLDEPGLPRFEKMIARFADTMFIGHGPSFWANIADGYDPARDGMYPQGPIRSPGAVVRIFKRHRNAHADISAASGYNALTRDAEFGWRFLEEFKDKLLFGTDVCRWPPAAPQPAFLRQGLAEKRLSKHAYERIGWRNALKLFRLK